MVLPEPSGGLSVNLPGRSREMAPFKRMLLDMLGVWRTADSGSAARWTLASLGHLPTVVHSRKLEVADRAMAGRTCRFRFQGVEIRLPGEYFSGAREIYCRRVYSFGQQFDIGPNDVIVDVGCNVGVFTVLAASAGKFVVAAEAQAGLIKEVESNLQMNGCADRARIAHALVGADTGVFSRDRASLADPWIGDPPRVSMSELTATLPKIDLMKIDIEGSEFALFSQETEASWLTNVRRIAMEVHPEFGSPASLASTLAAHGLNFQFVTNHGVPTSNLDAIGYLFAWR